MGKKTKRAIDRIKRGDFTLPSPSDIVNAMTPAGAWTAAQLAEWGVKWPPRRGWRAELEEEWRVRHNGSRAGANAELWWERQGGPLSSRLPKE